MSLKLFDLLRLSLPTLAPENAMIHLAVWNGAEHPFDVFRRGDFESWQAWQSKKFFERPVIVALVRMPGSASHWLFAGCFRREAVAPHPTAPKAWLYRTSELLECNEIAGRLVVEYVKRDRPHVRQAEGIADSMRVVELRARPVKSVVFMSHGDVRLRKDELDLIVRQADPEWVAALSSVLGIYVITDTSNGKLYVGSAGAETQRRAGGIWRRWCDYSSDGHGGDVELKQLLAEKGVEHARHFQYSILEVIEPSADQERVKSREGHWKRVLDSYRNGYNGNLESDSERDY